MPKKRGEDRFTTEQKYLKRFAKKHPVFRTILDCREKKTAITRYIYNVNSEGRVTTQYGHHPSTWRKCVAKGTLVSTPMGDIPVEDLTHGDLVYTYDEDRQLTIRRVLWAGKTGEKPVVRLHWEAAWGANRVYGHLDLTSDHPVRLLDGSYKPAGELDITWGKMHHHRHNQKGDRILSLHRGPFEGYIRLSGDGLPSGKGWMLEHRCVYQITHGNLSEHVHHQDGNKSNNAPDNLEGMRTGDHLGYETRKRGRLRRAVELKRLRALRKHLEETNYPYPVEECGYQPNHIISAIEVLPEVAEVYDVEVEDTHNFIANELCVHNSSRNDNLQNIPIRNAAVCNSCTHPTHKPNTCLKCSCAYGESLAEAIRGTMVARPGHVLIEADYEGIEAVIVGVLAGDKEYIRVCKAGLHGFTASRWMGSPIDINLPFAELRRQCKGIKKSHPEDYDRAKRGNHGVNYLLSPYGLNDEHPEAFPTLKSAKEYQDLYFGLFPKIRQWHQNILRVASKQTFLDNHYGIRHYFYNVLNWNPDTREYDKLGDDAKRVVAFIPQSDGSCIQNIDLLELAADPIIEPCLRLVIHDSKVTEVPLELVDYVCQRLHQVMSRPRPELGGETIGVEIAIGADLRKSAMDTWKPKEDPCLALKESARGGADTKSRNSELTVEGGTSTGSASIPTSSLP